MQFKVCFYTTSWGRCYIREYLDRLEVENVTLYATVLAKLQRAQFGQLHKRPLIDKVEGKNYFEIRPGGRNTSRIFFRKYSGQNILLMNGYTKKDNKLKPSHMAMADRISKDIDNEGGSYEEVGF